MDEEGGRPVFLQAHHSMALGGDGLPDYFGNNKELLIEFIYEISLNKSWDWTYKVGGVVLNDFPDYNWILIVFISKCFFMSQHPIEFQPPKPQGDIQIISLHNN